MPGKVLACASQEEAAYIGKALECAAAHLATSIEHATSQHSNTPLHSLAKLVAIPQQRTNPFAPHRSKQVRPAGWGGSLMRRGVRSGPETELVAHI